MKKIFIFLGITFWAVSQAFASPAVLSPSPVSAADASQVGIIAAVRGSVKIETPAKVGREVKSGAPVFLGDTVSTDEKGNLQIMLLDQTVFTIGPNSAIVIDKFIYDPSTQSGQVNAKVVKGIFRFVTGKIGQKNPDSMRVDLPAGTIGIRGTIVAGQAAGQRSFVVLLGPGERNNTRNRQGRIVVGNTVNGKLQAVMINHAGFGTVIEGGDGAPSPPFKVPAEMMSTITSALGSTSADSGQDSGDGKGNSSGGNGGPSPKAQKEKKSTPTQQAGQDTAQAAFSVKDSTVNAEVLGNLDSESSAASQNSVEDQNDIFNTLATFNDLQKIPSGQFKYEQQNVILYNSANTTSSVGSYNILLNIDFGARTVGGPNSSIDGTINSSHSFNFAIPVTSFGSGNEFAYYNFTNSNTTPSNSSIELDASVVFLNEPGNPGSDILHVVEIQDNTSGGPFPTGVGAGIAEREPV